MGAWVSKALSEVTRLDVPDLLKEHGPRTALQLTERHGVNAVPDILERLLRASAGVGVFTEDAAGRFGPTSLSDVLTIDSPVFIPGKERTMMRWEELYAAAGMKIISVTPIAHNSGTSIIEGVRV